MCAAFSAPGADHALSPGCPNLGIHSHGPAVPGGAELPGSRLGLRHRHHLLTGHHCGHHRGRTGSPAHVRPLPGKSGAMPLLGGIILLMALSVVHPLHAAHFVARLRGPGSIHDRHSHRLPHRHKSRLRAQFANGKSIAIYLHFPWIPMNVGQRPAMGLVSI